VKILTIHQKAVAISSEIRNAYIDFSKMTVSVAAVITDAVRNGSGSLVSVLVLVVAMPKDPYCASV
jgi:hypothetical protein